MSEVDLFGLENVLGYIKTYPNCNNISLKRNTAVLYTTPPNITQHQPAVDHFKEFVENHVMQQYGGNNFTMYKLHLNQQTKTKSQPIANPVIQFMESQVQPKPQIGKINIDNNGFTNREFIELASENAALKFQIKQLEQEIDELQTQVIELESELEQLEPSDKPKGIGDVVSDVLVKNADGIVMMLANKMFGGQNIAMAGVETPEQVLHQMLLVEPDFLEHLKLLLKLRKYNPDMYVMALNQLKNLV